MKLIVVQVRQNDRWEAVAVLEGRRYPDAESLERARTEAFETLDDHGIPAQLETHQVRPDEPPSRLPHWEDYRKTLGPPAIDSQTVDRACELLAEYHNEGLPEGFTRTRAEDFKGYQITSYEEWLIFASPSSFTNQTFLVSDPMVFESPGWESYEDALVEARALKAVGATRRPEDPDEDDDDEDD